MAEELRLSQLITTFGPGALVDFPKYSVIIGGLDDWPDFKGAMRLIDEPRLRELLERKLKDAQRLDPAAVLQLREPPVVDDLRKGRQATITSRIFPEWFVCDAEPNAREPAPRRLVRFDQLTDQKKLVYRDGTHRLNASPIRFVGACARGHVQDLDWRSLVHGGDRTCQEPLRLVDRGTSGDPRDISMICDCGARITLVDLYQPGRLRSCQGHQPWIAPGYRERDCDEPLKLLTRGAVNAYFAQTLRLISLPDTTDALTAAVQRHLDDLKDVTSPQDVLVAKKFNGQLRNALGEYDAEDIFERIRTLAARAAPGAAVEPSLRHDEFDVLTSGHTLIGSPGFGSKLHAETVPEDDWRRPSVSFDALLRRVVRVHRLREVTALFGFTRLDPPPGAYDDGQDEFQLNVEGAPLSKNATWLPAIEQFGEGIFVELDVPLVRSRVGCVDGLAERDKDMRARHQAWARRRGRPDLSYRGLEYVLAHSLAHGLIEAIALEAGYPTTALKERIYALPAAGDRGGPVARLGILIYTAGGGSQGTLGGLVEMAQRLPELISRVLDDTQLCSNDPICISNTPTLSPDSMQVNGSACHSCLFIPETSCENQNMLLDRHYLPLLL